jgi:hypothetical protein
MLAAGAATSVQATTFTGSYGESHNAADPGLKLLTNNLAPSPFSFNLTNVGDTAHQNLFQLYTNEASLDFDDLAGKPISVTLAFTAPSNFGGTIGGTTDGAFTFSLSGFFNLTENNFGTLSWANNGNQVLDFGNGGQLLVHLDDANFNLTRTSFGDSALTPGLAGAATVTADFTLKAAAVPEPASWALMIGGFGMAGATLRRRRAALA